MKKVIQLFLIMLPIGAFAQQGMSQADMERMMQQAENMKVCMTNVDQSVLMALSEKAQAIKQKLKNLCQLNKRDEAQNSALEFGREIAVNNEMKKMRECGEMMRGMMPKIGIPTVEEMKERHICDDY